MEHTSHVEQQLRLQHEASDPETAEEVLSRHVQLQDQLKKAPQNTIREGNELLRSLEQVCVHVCVCERERVNSCLCKCLKMGYLSFSVWL